MAMGCASSKVFLSREGGHVISCVLVMPTLSAEGNILAGGSSKAFYFAEFIYGERSNLKKMRGLSSLWGG